MNVFIAWLYRTIVSFLFYKISSISRNYLIWLSDKYFWSVQKVELLKKKNKENGNVSVQY